MPKRYGTYLEPGKTVVTANLGTSAAKSAKHSPACVDLRKTKRNNVRNKDFYSITHKGGKKKTNQYVPAPPLCSERTSRGRMTNQQCPNHSRRGTRVATCQKADHKNMDKVVTKPTTESFQKQKQRQTHTQACAALKQQQHVCL